jgi:predicted amidophosphoribosyltransferase
MGFLLPSSCGGCRAPGWVVCPACISQLRRAPPDLPCPPGLDTCRALVAYDGPARELIGGLKYRNHRAALGWLVAALAPLATAGVEAVTWAPTTAARRRRRGYDQAELLARALARRLRLPPRALLSRHPQDCSQTALGRSARLENPRFRVRAGPPRRVLVVDDVTTTGATLSAAAAVLRRAGAAEVHGLTVAATVDGSPHPERPSPYHGSPVHGTTGRHGT